MSVHAEPLPSPPPGAAEVVVVVGAAVVGAAVVGAAVVGAAVVGAAVVGASVAGAGACVVAGVPESVEQLLAASASVLPKATVATSPSMEHTWTA